MIDFCDKCLSIWLRIRLWPGDAFFMSLIIIDWTSVGDTGQAGSAIGSEEAINCSTCKKWRESSTVFWGLNT